MRTATEAVAAQGRKGRLGDVGDGIAAGIDRDLVGRRLRAVVAHLLELGDVGARTEVVPRTGQDDRPDLLVALERGEDRRDRAPHRIGHRVATARAVQCDDGNLIRDPDLDLLGGQHVHHLRSRGQFRRGRGGPDTSLRRRFAVHERGSHGGNRRCAGCARQAGEIQHGRQRCLRGTAGTKKSSADLRAAASTMREPSCASLPPTLALTA